MNIWDILILLAIFSAVTIAFRILRGKKQRGECTCGCGGCTKDCPIKQEQKAETNH